MFFKRSEKRNRFNKTTEIKGCKSFRESSLVLKKTLILFKVVGCLCLLGLLGMGGVALGKQVKKSNLFRARQFVFEGDKHSKNFELLQYAGYQPNKSIFNINIDHMSTSMARHPWVKSALVRRRWPDSVFV